ncbi:MAG: competence/damage-inducible protein A [Ignavibacteria bacterium]|nr:competence/damage-inducible protein A [Ignavibacteria bacterium]
MVTAKVISIGDEILIGQIVNTNSAYINKQLYSNGIKVVKVVTIGDNEKDLLDELDDSMKNFDITLITGGLGPTHDDITKPILVKYFEDKLVLNEEILTYVREFFAKRNLEMPETNIEQAMVPANAEIIWNHNGTAPGIWIEKDNKVFAAMPGVPFEMKAMIEDDIIPKLKKKFSGRFDYVLKSKTLLTTGIGESLLFERIGDINSIIGKHSMAFLPSPLGVRLRIDIKADNLSEAEKETAIIEEKLRAKIGEYIYGENDDLLEDVAGRMLKERNLTLAAAESCTGGLLSGRITDIPGSSDYYIGGVCAYSNKIKTSVLGVSETTLENHGAVSENTAMEMASGIRLLFGSSIGISVTGIAGPGGGTEEKPVGLTYIGYSDDKKCFAVKWNFGDNRERNRIRTVQACLNLLRNEIKKK